MEVLNGVTQGLADMKIENKSHGVALVQAILMSQLVPTANGSSNNVGEVPNTATTTPSCVPTTTMDVLDSDLPPLGPCLSTCKWLPTTTGGDEDVYEQHRRMSDADERMSFTTASSTAIYYTIHRPYETTILNARYLTRTSLLDAASGTDLACANHDSSEDSSSMDETLQRMFQFYEKQFPLELSSSAEEPILDERNGKRVIELRVSLPDDYTLEYQPGDSLGLVVDNTVQAVQFVLNMLQHKHGVVSQQLVSIDGKRAIPVEEVVRSQMDLCSPLKNKRILRYLSTIASDPDDRTMLRLLASKTKTGEDLFRLYVEEQRRTIVDILQDFPSCQVITLDGLLSILPGIPPRYYSVSSSPLDRRNEDIMMGGKENNGGGEQVLSLTIAFSVVDYLTPSLRVGHVEYGKRRIGGVATRYLEAICTPWLNKKQGTAHHQGTSSLWSFPTTLKIFPKPSAEFRLPSNLSTPMILIGPGTGIAPFMGFLAHRQAQLSNLESSDAAHAVVEGTWRGGYELEADELPVSSRDARGLVVGADYRSHQHVGSVDVFFGCRHADHDWLYREEMQYYVQRGIIQELYTAFSRDDNVNHPRCIYVQDLMRHDKTSQRLVHLLMEENASVYLCGDGNEMAKDVQATLIELLAKHGFDGSDEKAKAFFETMKAQKRFLMDIWTS